MKMRGAHIIWSCLVEQGVDTVFGYPGGAILPAYDALLDHPIRHVLVRHEQGATHMADGYARASGRAGTVSHRSMAQPMMCLLVRLALRTAPFTALGRQPEETGVRVCASRAGATRSAAARASSAFTRSRRFAALAVTSGVRSAPYSRSRPIQ